MAVNRRRFFELTGLSGENNISGRFMDRISQLSGSKGLGEKVICAEFGGLNRFVKRGVSRNHDSNDGLPSGVQFLQYTDTVDTGTRYAIPCSLPASSGMTVVTALAAPVVVGTMFIAAARARRRSL